MATRIGLEPTTPSVTGWCSNQLSYRAMIAQVRAASYRGNVLYYIGKSVCCQAQICGKCNFLQKRVKVGCLGRLDDFKWLPLRSSHLQRKKYFKFRVCRALRSAPNAIFTGGVVAGNGSCCACSPGGAVAQRLRGCKSAEPEKTVKRSSRRTGVNLQFFPV